jgi:ferric-dicitrate binding protein FerR (iron transport regulator)
MNESKDIDDVGRDGDDDLRELLRAAGPRVQPPPDLAEQVRAAVAAEWRTVVAERQPRRRNVTWFAAAASVAAVAVGAWLLLPQLAPAGPMATVARVSGTAEVLRDGESGWQPLAAGVALMDGDAVRTSGPSRLALHRPDGLDVRLDGATQLALADSGSARLEHGRVYVDAGPAGTRADAFAIDTPFGEVRHLGTQYSVQLDAGALGLAVREGSVSVTGPQATVIARAGEALRIDANRVQRSDVAAWGEAWRWAEDVAPDFPIEGRSLDEFLTWAARQTGRQLVYGSAEAARAAESTELRGAIAGLAPEAAVAAVMATTPALQHRFADGQLRIEPAQ